MSNNMCSSKRSKYFIIVYQAIVFFTSMRIFVGIVLQEDSTPAELTVYVEQHVQ